MASPFSTGGGGTIFEIKVQVGLLAALLVRGYLPAFQNAYITELHLQAEHLGYETDDALVIALDDTGRQRRQLWSIKHEVAFTDSDEIFRDVITDAWVDFSDTKRFDRALDAIVLATSPLKATNKSLLTLLEFARASASAKDFLARVSRKGLISEKSRGYFTLMQKICNEVADRQVIDEELWGFIRCLHIIGYDFDQTASQDEARFRTLLALAVRNDTGKTGDELWNAIFKWIADLNPRAGSFTRENLPVEWQQVTLNIAQHFESGVIHRLLEHSGDLLKRIRTSLGQNLHLNRTELTPRLAEAFVSEQFTLVAGQAGVGKSAASLVALREVLDGAPLFVFQATEFARDSLDHAFSDLRVTEPLSRISALFALHPRKFLLIESVERLLESMERDAFFTLLARLAEDSTWRVVLTCRSHAISMVRDAFITPLGINCVGIEVPLLDQAELDYVIQSIPNLQAIASHSRSRDLLRNPYYLDKACSVDWSKEAVAAPLDEHRLRDVLWRQAVVREDVRISGIHLQRGRVFRDIALRRARSLQSFVEVQPGEEVAVQALVADELLAEEPSNHFVAPAHDVLEDWALVQWISETFYTQGEEPQRFFDILGHELPIRRSYRHWLQETLTTGTLPLLPSFIDHVIDAPNVEPYWKDETLVSILLSDEASRFIESHEASLFANDKYQLRRIIHLLRVACKKPNPLWALPEEVLGRSLGDTHLVPDGKAWGAIIRLIYRNLASFLSNDLPLLLGLLEDWKAGVSWQKPAPDAAREAGLIALHFWNSLDDHWRRNETMERLASILLASPQAIAVEFEALLGSEVEDDERRDYRGEILEKKLLTSFDGWAACRSHSEAVARFAERQWGIDRPMPKKSPWKMGGISQMEDYFGLPPRSHMVYFPSSGLYGPFLCLLQAKPKVGMDLILKLVNVTTERYVKLGLDDKYGQGAIKIELDFNEGAAVEQWASPRLWMMYRQGMPGPSVVESALMALEKWLLDLAEAGRDLRDITRELISKSNSVAITAVVGSVAMAHPFKVGDAALVLLRAREFFELDWARYMHDLIAPSTGLSTWAINAADRVYSNERADSDNLPHRKQNLEWLALTLQTGPLRDEVWRIIDEFKQRLPPTEEQTEEDKLWRLRLHRIDLRNFSPKEELEDGRVLFASKPPDEDVAEVVEKNAPALRATEEEISVIAWAMSVFERRDVDKFDPVRWREMLNRARQLAGKRKNENASKTLSYEGGSGYVAAVCVRDHWNELTPEERIWCREFLLSKISEEKDSTNEMERVQKFSMASSRAAARVLPLLLDDTNEATRKRVCEAIAVAMTHAIEEVREFTANAISSYLWERDAGLASACIAGLLDLAALERRTYGKWRRNRSGSEAKFYDLVQKNISKVRRRIASGEPLVQQEYYRFSVEDPFSVRILPLVVTIICQEQVLPLSQSLFRQIAESLVHSWKHEHQDEDHRDYEAESVLKTQFANFLVRCEVPVALRLWEPIAGAIPANADEVAEVFERIIYAQDTIEKNDTFWRVWQETANRLVSVPNPQEKLVKENSGLTKLGAVLLLDHIFWKETARDWKPLRGHEDQLQKFFGTIGTAPPLWKSFVKLLDSVGSILLPEALIWIDDRLSHGDPSAMIGDRNSLFHLACILTPLIFSQTGVIKKSPALRDATLRILDAMVEQGSSAAFRMRDFLVTPFAPVIRSVQDS